MLLGTRLNAIPNEHWQLHSAAGLIFIKIRSRLHTLTLARQMLMGPLKASKKFRGDSCVMRMTGWWMQMPCSAQQAAGSSLPASDEARWFASALADAEDAE